MINIKNILEDYISDIDLILDYNEQFGGCDEEYYIKLKAKLEVELDNIRRLESGHKYGGVNDKSISF